MLVIRRCDLYVNTRTQETSISGPKRLLAFLFSASPRGLYSCLDYDPQGLTKHKFLKAFLCVREVLIPILILKKIFIMVLTFLRKLHYLKFEYEYILRQISRLVIQQLGIYLSLYI